MKNRKIILSSVYGQPSLSIQILKRYAGLRYPGKSIYFYVKKSFSDKWKRVGENWVSVEWWPEVTATLTDYGKETTYLESFVPVGDEFREDPNLIKAIEEIGSTKYRVVDIGESLYTICDYDGYETVLLKDKIDWK